MKVDKAIEALHAKTEAAMAMFQNLPKDNIKRNLMEIIQSQVARVKIAARVHERFIEKEKDEFFSYFGNDQQMADNYLFGYTNDLVDNIATTIFFQTELVFRAIYANNFGKKVGDPSGFQPIIAHIFSDTENNWKMEESKLTILLWKLRNMSHGGGIFFDGDKEPELDYKGKKYKFEYGKIPDFQMQDFFPLLNDFIDTLVFAFEHKPCLSSNIPHPFYGA